MNKNVENINIKFKRISGHYNFKYNFLFFKSVSLFFILFYLFIFREKAKEGEREGEKHQCAVASHVPCTREPGLQPRHVP